MQSCQSLNGYLAAFAGDGLVISLLPCLHQNRLFSHFISCLAFCALRQQNKVCMHMSGGLTMNINYGVLCACDRL